MALRATHVTESDVRNYFSTLFDVLCNLNVTSASGRPIAIADAIGAMVERARDGHAKCKRMIFVGNGGSAAIASHMATDYSKNGGIRALSFNDGSMLTCLGNDYGFEHVFSKQVEFHGQAGDFLVAISSSGHSKNILNAVDAAYKAGCTVVTLSGFTPDNPLRARGEWNFYIDSTRYGFVELAHLTICHAILDFLCAREVDGTSR
jgi:D-sedoheptulose 7-phosphate isomerase